MNNTIRIKVLEVARKKETFDLDGCISMFFGQHYTADWQEALKQLAEEGVLVEVAQKAPKGCPRYALAPANPTIPAEPLVATEVWKDVTLECKTKFYSEDCSVMQVAHDGEWLIEIFCGGILRFSSKVNGVDYAYATGETHSTGDSFHILRRIA